MAWNSLVSWIVAQAPVAADAAAKAVAEPPSDDLSVALRLLAAVGVIVGSFMLGTFIARSLRLPDLSFKIGIITFALVAGMVINVVGWPPKRGIDLSGGVVLIYEVDRGETKPSWMPTAIAELNSDLNRGEGERVDVRESGPTEIEIITPAGFDPDQVERAVLALRSRQDLTFDAVGEPRTENGKAIYTYAADERHKAVEMDKLITAINKRINPGGVKELTIRQYGAEQVEIIIPEVEPREIAQIKKRISTSGLLEFRIVANENDDPDIIRAAERTVGSDVYIGGKLVGRWVKMGQDFVLSSEARGKTRPNEVRGPEVLARIDRFNIDGGYLSRAARDTEQGRPIVVFSLDSEGGRRFGQLTQQNLPDEATQFHRHLGIILDGTMISAPQLNSTIHERGQIEGVEGEEADILVDVLNAGSLPATLRPEPIMETTISPQLGEDTIRKGGLAMVVSTAAILVFMLVYYRWAGIVADVAVTLNVVITVALMILIKAAFTLPGLAGLVLTVGMAVDANVLIYERMREELERGASLRMAIRNGFSRATATIIDSNLTTLITAVVLYMIGTDQIKGFAVTLILGLLVSMFTAIIVSRVIFDIAERKRWISQLRMMRIIGHTNFDFIRWRTPAIVGSVVLIVIGLAAAAGRGKELLDIDFTGGSSVQLLFADKKGRDIAEVRSAVASLPDVAVSSMGETNREFKIDTSESDVKKVEEVLKTTFRDALQTYSMSFGPLATIEAPKEEPKAGPEGEQPSGDQPAPNEAATPTEESEPDPAKPAEPEAPASEPGSPAPEQPKSDERTTTDGPAVPPPATTGEPGSNQESPKAEAPAPADAPQSSWDFRQSNIQLASLGKQAALAALVVAQDEPSATDDAPKEPSADEKAETPAAPDTDAAPESEAAPATQTAPDTDAPIDATPTTDTPAATAGDDTAGNPLVGGTRVELNFPQEINYEQLTGMINEQLATMNLVEVAYLLRNPDYQPGSEAPQRTWTLEIGLDQEQTKTLVEGMQKKMAETPVFAGSSQIGGKVAGDTQLMAVYAMVASMVMIVIYVWVRFQNIVFGLAAVLALVHDVLVSAGFLAISAYVSPYLGALLVDPFKISLAVVAALLTIVGFSINDTIVTFDRIREVRGKSPQLTADMINRSVNQVLSRTLLTAGTVLIASVILYVVGGPGIHAFAYTMVVGVVAGTYSSVYIAAPILLWMRRPATTKQQAASAGRALGSEARQPSA